MSAPLFFLHCVGCGMTWTGDDCPPASPTFGDGCLAEGCPSYDIRRDVDLFWDDPTIRIERTPL